MTQSTEIRALQKLWVNLLRDIIKLNETSVMNNMHPKESGIIFDRKVDLSMAFLINLVYEMKKCSEQMAQVTGQHNKDDDITHTNINDNNNDTDNDFNYNFNEIIILIRLCINNDIQKKNITFSEWLLNLLQDKQEFENKMINLKKYIIGSDINAEKLNKQIIKRKDFATNCDQCDIPRGVSTKLHKELTKRTNIHKQWNSNDIFNFMKDYLESITKTKKIKIIEKIKKEKIGKYEFIQKYAYSNEECMNKIHDFLRTKIEYTKKEQTLKQMSHRIYLCIGLYNNMYTIDNNEFIKNLTKYNYEYKQYQLLLNKLGLGQAKPQSQPQPQTHLQ
eukprot:503557_1